MAFGSSSDNNIEIKVVVDADGTIKVLDTLGDEVARVQDAAEKADGGFSKFQAGLVTLNSALDLASRGFGILKSVSGTAIDALSRGSDVADVEAAFTRLSTKAGILSDTFINQLQESTAGTVSKFDLMRTANDKLNAGLKPDQIIAMSDAARVFADESGADFNTVLQEIESSVVRGNDKFLKSKGIIVDNNKAYEDFAKSVGLTADQLNEVGKAEALREATLEALRKKLVETGKAQVDVGDSIKAVGATFTNAFDEISKSLAGDAGITKLLADFANGLTIIIPGAVKVATSAINGLIKVIDTVASAAGKIAEIGRGTSFAAAKIGSPEAFENFDKTAKGIKNIGDSADAIRQNLKKADDGFNDFIDTLRKDETPKVTENTKKYIDTTKIAVTEKKKDQTEFERLSAQAAKYGITLTQVNGKIIELGNSGKILKDLPKDFSFGSPDAGGLGLDFSQAIANSVLDGLQTAFQALASGQFTKETAGDIGSGLGQAIGGTLGTSLGAAFGPIGAAAGGVLGDKLGEGVYSAIDHVFGGGKDPGNKARKAADRFFADLFEPGQLSVIIDGQLQQLKDLTFGDGSFFASGQFGAVFDSISQSARESFQGVGAAFEQLLGTGEEVAGQLAAVFANNLGGSLNNLQLLVQASGKSFQEMEGLVVQAFEQGKISALDAQVALSGIQQIAQKGIPDAIGGVSIAFANLEAAGVKGGLASKDALQDLASEAKELHKQTLPELQAALLNTAGADQEAINKLFNSLNTYGVTTLDQLENLSSQTAIAILANLQAQNFPFAEQIEQLDDIKNKIDEIPDNIRRNLTFDVRVNASGEDRSLISKGQVTVPGGPGLG